jgi:hypothetical protein
MNFGKKGPRKSVYKGPVTIVLPNLKMITGQNNLLNLNRIRPCRKYYISKRQKTSLVTTIPCTAGDVTLATPNDSHNGILS